MRKKILIATLVIAVFAVALWIYFGVRNTEKAFTLQVQTPVIGYIAKSVTATGTIEPVDTVSIGCQVSGTIKTIYVDFNDKVKKGQLIAELDKSLFEAAANQYAANLELAKSNLSYQQINFTRQQQLFQVGGISKADFDLAQNQWESAKATVRSVQSQLDAAQKNLSYANIYSPVDGVVLFRNISIGQTVAASFNTPTLFIIAKDITKMQVQAAVDEADIGSVRPGLWANFTVDAYPDIVFAGKVREVRLKPAVSANVVTYTTIIDAPNDDQKLKPGMTANIFIYIREDDHALLIPVKATRFSPDPALSKMYTLSFLPKETQQVAGTVSQGNDTSSASNRHMTHVDTATSVPARIWVKSGKQLIEKSVRMGMTDDNHLQVLEGLSPEDSVVLAATQGPTQPAVDTKAPVRSPFMPARRQTTPSTLQKAKANSR